MRKVAEVSPKDLATTLVTVEEQFRGWLNLIRRTTSDQGLPGAYARLHSALKFFQRIQLVEFDSASLEHYERLRGQKIRVGTCDLRIAAIVLGKGGVLVTRNARDFSRIPALTCEDWSVG